jgi:ATP-dependent helicase/nuclease subunit A
VGNSISIPPDQDQRNIILEELDRSILVEAAAGTGKTTSMIGRMVNLLAAGKCSVDTLAAVTFTRKAAAELRSRFQIQLEKAHREAGGRTEKLLGLALSGLERCFIGTIHSFCARMLRERPVEAGVDIAFEEIDENQDQVFREQAWDQYVAGLYAEDSPILHQLEDLGVEIGQLRATFTRFANYPDVDSWPARALPAPDPSSGLISLECLVRHMEALVPTLPEHYGNDKLMPKYRMIPLMFRQLRRDRLSEVMEIFAQFKTAKPVLKLWPGGPGQAKAEEALWNEFATDVAQPLVKAWLEHRYEPLISAVRPAVAMYDNLRKRAGKLNYQDLLMRAAGLLRDKPSIREYFRRRFTHLLVDEFQDTDPVQAEVLLHLTADNPTETDWRKCRPVPGSLFVVGDPKQSIYRFRRADIVTYNRVKDIIRESGGLVAHLSANFRTLRPLIDWVNATFTKDFAAYPPECSPEYVPLLPVREVTSESSVTKIRSLLIPKDFRKTDEIGEYEANIIAATIRNAIDTEVPVPRAPKEIEAGVEPKANPGDFLIVTPNTGNLGLYGRKLQELGIPHQVTGSSALNQAKELSLLHTCLTALTQPDNPIALVATLRSELFGISDAALYEFKRFGGCFSFNSPVPSELTDCYRQSFETAFARLKHYTLWMAGIPAVAAVEKIICDLGLAAWCSASAGGDVRAGSLAKAVELLRASEKDSWTPADFVDCLEKIINREENHDSISARVHQSAVVRIMNLHKVKGLEAPIVFLADPSGQTKRQPNLHIDRSGKEALGYMTIEGNPFGMSLTVLAQPEHWETLAEIEDDFKKAENLRLLYVAATRAGCGLTISQRKTFQNQNPWSYFDPKLKGSCSVADPGPQAPHFRPVVTFTDSDVDDAEESIARQWERAKENTYAVVSVKTASVHHGKFTYSLGEHGTEWGSVIHLLLQSLMLDPESDLASLAVAALADQGLDSALANEAIETARSVTHSEIWLRARNCKRVLAEVPFQIPAAASCEGSADVPTILRGVIDLVFEEDDGWVIVDYKSDRVGEAHINHLVELYKQQVLGYSDAWERITRSRVTETGLYFTFCGRYVQV